MILLDSYYKSSVNSRVVVVVGSIRLAIVLNSESFPDNFFLSFNDDFAVAQILSFLSSMVTLKENEIDFLSASEE